MINSKYVNVFFEYKRKEAEVKLMLDVLRGIDADYGTIDNMVKSINKIKPLLQKLITAHAELPVEIQDNAESDKLLCLIDQFEIEQERIKKAAAKYRRVDIGIKAVAALALGGIVYALTNRSK